MDSLPQDGDSGTGGGDAEIKRARPRPVLAPGARKSQLTRSKTITVEDTSRQLESRGALATPLATPDALPSIGTPLEGLRPCAFLPASRPFSGHWSSAASLVSIQASDSSANPGSWACPPEQHVASLTFAPKLPLMEVLRHGAGVLAHVRQKPKCQLERQFTVESVLSQSGPSGFLDGSATWPSNPERNNRRQGQRPSRRRILPDLAREPPLLRPASGLGASQSAPVLPSGGWQLPALPSSPASPSRHCPPPLASPTQLASRPASRTATPLVPLARRASQDLRRPSKIAVRRPSKILTAPVGPRSPKDAAQAALEAAEGLQPVDGGLVVDELAARLRTGANSEDEDARTQKYFNKLVMPGTSDVEREGLYDIIRDMGYILTNRADVERIAAECLKGGVVSVSNFEFGSVVDRITVHESERARIVFDKHAQVHEDADGPTVDVGDLGRLLRDLGFVTVDAVVEDSLAQVGLQAETCFNLDSFLVFLAALLASECFSRPEIQRAAEAYVDQCVDGVLPPDNLIEAILQLVSHRCVHLQQQVLEWFGVCGFRAGGGRQGAGGYSFHAFLAVARRLRNCELLLIRTYFDECDRDADELLTLSELHELMAIVGYTLIGSCMDELLGDIGKKRDDLFAFEDTLRFSAACQESQGFCREEFMELVAAFSRFDPECTNELSVMQALKLLAFLGHGVDAEDLTDLIKAMDFNNNGVMDVGEYLYLMRRHRESELCKYRAEFNRLKDRSGKLPMSRLEHAMSALGLEYRAEYCSRSPAKVLLVAQKTLGLFAKKPLEPQFDFDEFYLTIEEQRQARAAQRHKRADFSDDEFAVIKRVFEEHIKSANKHPQWLGVGELLWLLQEFGLPVHTREGRAELLDLVEKSRGIARLSGAKLADPGFVGLLTLVHILRFVAKKTEAVRNTNEMAAARETGFSPSEVISFRTVFTEALPTLAAGRPVTAGSILGEGTPLCASPRPMSALSDSSDDVNGPPAPIQRAQTDVPKPSALDRLRGAAGRLGSSSRCQTPDSMCGSDRALSGPSGPPGATLSPAGVVGLDRTRTHAEVAEVKILLRRLTGATSRQQHLALNERATALAEEDGCIDFANFLRLMKWVLDSNFASVKNMAAASKEANPLAESRSSLTT